MEVCTEIWQELVGIEITMLPYKTGTDSMNLINSLEDGFPEQVAIWHILKFVYIFCSLIKNPDDQLCYNYLVISRSIVSTFQIDHIHLIDLYLFLTAAHRGP